MATSSGLLATHVPRQRRQAGSCACPCARAPRACFGRGGGCGAVGGARGAALRCEKLLVHMCVLLLCECLVVCASPCSGCGGSCNGCVCVKCAWAPPSTARSRPGLGQLLECARARLRQTKVECLARRAGVSASRASERSVGPVSALAWLYVLPKTQHYKLRKIKNESCLLQRY